MHTCIPSHGLKKSWYSCPSQVNAGNKNTPNMHHPWRWNVTTSVVWFKKMVTYTKISPKTVNPRDIAEEGRRRRRPWPSFKVTGVQESNNYCTNGPIHRVDQQVCLSQSKRRSWHSWCGPTLVYHILKSATIALTLVWSWEPCRILAIKKN